MFNMYFFHLVNKCKVRKENAAQHFNNTTWMGNPICVLPTLLQFHNYSTVSTMIESEASLFTLRKCANATF